MAWSLLLAALLCVLPAAAPALECLDEDGAAVPWFFVFKQNGGLDYAYVDANTPPAAGGPLQLVGRTLDCAGGAGRCALGATLQALMDAAAAGAAARVSWNDELPAAADSAAPAPPLGSATSGHVKGVLGANASGGFLLAHTLPKFPVLTVPAYGYTGSTIYAQTFLCISLTPDEVENAAAGVQYIDPYIYASVVPSGALTSQYPVLTALVAGARSAGTAKLTLRSTAGNIFSYFVKSGSTGVDLWQDVVQAGPGGLGVNLWVETWRRPPVMDTYCAPPYSYDSINVDSMRYLDADGAEVAYRYTQDHSKLAVAVNATAQTQWICVADNNRMTSQWARGGGALCWRFAPLFNALVSAVTIVDGCPPAAA